MKESKETIVRYIFLFLVLVDLYAELMHHRELAFVLKPFLLPTLGLYYAVSVKGKWTKPNWLIVLAICFSWVGDISLAITPQHAQDVEIFGITKNKYFFLGGVGGFMVAHLFFIAAYLRSQGQLFAKKKWIFLPIVLYGVTMIALVVPRVYADVEKKPAAFPVMVYACVLCSMVAFALNRYGRVGARGFLSVFFGALLFLLSDSLIALNFLVFEGIIPQAGFWIMVTFLSAEYLITDGMLRERNP